ncbi:transposase [Mesorhizobium sp. ArgA1]
MRRQTLPFIVEVRQKRGYERRNGSIWGDIDFSAAFAEASKELQNVAPSSHQDIDSSIVGRDAEGLQQTTLEHQMPDPEQAESTGAATEGATKLDTPGTKKKPRSSGKIKAQSTPPARTNGAEAAAQANGVAAATASAPRKVYSEKDRAQKLTQIERSVRSGATHRSAVKQAGISEQTYYLWKKATIPAAETDELKDLVALEEENKRLKSLLAERLRQENAELKKRLGLH